MSMNRDKNVTEESVIPVERINGPVLLMSTKADTIWSCDTYTEKLIKRFQENHFPFEVQHISFQYMSHFLLPMEHKKSLKWIRMLFQSERLHQKECVKERKEMENATLEYLEKTFL